MKLFDEIGEWTRRKLDLIEEYAAPYADIMSSRKFKYYYIDAFCGAGVHVAKKTNVRVDGSPLRVMKIKRPYTGYYFIDRDGNKTRRLKILCETRYKDRNAKVLTGDCNQILEGLLPLFSYDKYERLLCLLDPYGMHLDWRLMEKMGDMGIVDLVLNFPIMDMNRNALLKRLEEAPLWGKESFTRFWGDESWVDFAYYQQGTLSGGAPSLVKRKRNQDIAEEFGSRLRSVAKFKYVSSPVVMKNSGGATLYYLFFASQNPTAYRIAMHLLKKHGGNNVGN